MTTSSIDSSFEALERIQSELQNYGLTLNEEKSRVRRATSYRDGLGQVDRRTAEAQANQEVDLTLVDELDLIRDQISVAPEAPASGTLPKALIGSHSARQPTTSCSQRRRC